MSLLESNLLTLPMIGLIHVNVALILFPKSVFLISSTREGAGGKSSA